LGDAESMGVTSTPLMTLRNTTAAAAGAQQVSPSLVLEGRGWRTNATAQSQVVRFRQNVLPVQGAASPSAQWRLQSEINNDGNWQDRLRYDTATSRFFTDTNFFNGIGSSGFGFLTFFSNNGDTLGVWGGNGVVIPTAVSLIWTDGDLNGNRDLFLRRARANVLAINNGAAACGLEIANTHSSATNRETGMLRWGSNTLQIGTEKGSSGGTARPMSFVTDGTDRLTIDALGRIIPVLPTSAAGLPTGALWNDAGTVKVAP
jgi:hypothetical protein